MGPNRNRAHRVTWLWLCMKWTMETAFPQASVTISQKPEKWVKHPRSSHPLKISVCKHWPTNSKKKPLEFEFMRNLNCWMYSQRCKKINLKYLRWKTFSKAEKKAFSSRASAEISTNFIVRCEIYINPLYFQWTISPTRPQAVFTYCISLKCLV